METCSVTHFRNHALAILDGLAKTGGELLVMRHGKPVARVSGVRQPQRLQLGKLKGAMRMNGDITVPLGAEDWGAAR